MAFDSLVSGSWACVVPAYNEAPRLGAVLAVLAECDWIARVVVLDDGSRDETAEVACAFVASHGATPDYQQVEPGASPREPLPSIDDAPHPVVHVVSHARNAGKAMALVTAIQHTREPLLLMVDADLLGLQPEHVRALAEPVEMGRVEMTTGIFRGGRLNTDAAHAVAPGLSGQRAMTRAVWERFLARGDDPAAMAYGVEEALEDLVKHGGVRREMVIWQGVSHTTKEEKVGLVAGWAWRLKMYREVLRTRLGADWEAWRTRQAK